MSKSKTQYVKLTGKVAWAHRLIEPDEYMGKENYTVNFYPDEAGKEFFKKSGLRLQPKTETREDTNLVGEVFVRLRRPTERDFKDGKTFFMPPFIYNKDGSPLVTFVDQNGKAHTQHKGNIDLEQKGEYPNIGNGSEVEVELSIYDAGPYGKGHRLESVRIIDLIEYVAPEEEEQSEPEVSATSSVTTNTDDHPWA